MNGSQKRDGCFVISCSNSTGLLELGEEVLDEMSSPIQDRLELSLLLVTLSGRDDDLDSFNFENFEDSSLSNLGLICDELFGFEPRKELVEGTGQE